jgi:hypothetical protein
MLMVRPDPHPTEVEWDASLVMGPNTATHSVPRLQYDHIPTALDEMQRCRETCLPRPHDNDLGVEYSPHGFLLPTGGTGYWPKQPHYATTVVI